MVEIFGFIGVFTSGMLAGLLIAKKLGPHWTAKERKVDE